MSSVSFSSVGEQVERMRSKSEESTETSQAFSQNSFRQMVGSRDMIPSANSIGSADISSESWLSRYRV